MVPATYAPDTRWDILQRRVPRWRILGTPRLRDRIHGWNTRIRIMVMDLRA